MSMYLVSVFFFFNDTATTEIYTLSLHDALPICRFVKNFKELFGVELAGFLQIFNRDLHGKERIAQLVREAPRQFAPRDRKSTRLNSSHQIISYAVFCLKKKKKKQTRYNDSQLES